MRPARQQSQAAWELRAAWRSLLEIVVSWPAGRIRGYVEHVAATDEFALMWDGCETMHVPLAVVSTVRRPHVHEDGIAGSVAKPPPRTRIPIQLEGQLAFSLKDPRLPDDL